jgi:putative endonuclease
MENKHAASHLFGLQAEKIARLWLRLKGYRILAERLKTPYGEIDIVAKRGAWVAIVEVKARPTLRECIEAVSPRQQARIMQAANSLLAFPSKLARELNGLETNLRFDLIAIRPYRLPHHMMDAWRM